MKLLETHSLQFYRALVPRHASVRASVPAAIIPIVSCRVPPRV